MTFMHAGDPAPYTPADMAPLGRFPIVQFDKKQVRRALPSAHFRRAEPAARSPEVTRQVGMVTAI